MLPAGEGIVEVSRRGAVSAVTRLVMRSPLKILTPRNHGRAAWVYTTSYGGGLVDGDVLRLRVQVGPGATAYLATQASTKVYPGDAGQEIEADVGAGGLLISLPDPVVCFAGASYRQQTIVRLAATGSLVWLEALTAGRTARGERWRFARFRAHTRIERDGTALAVDGLLLDAEHGPLAPRLGRFDALATLVAVGASTAPLRAQLLDAGSPVRRGASVLVAPSPVGDDAAVVRVAADSPEALARTLRRLLAPVVALLGDDPFCRKGSLVWDDALH